MKQYDILIYAREHEDFLSITRNQKPAWNSIMIAQCSLSLDVLSRKTNYRGKPFIMPIRWRKEDKKEKEKVLFYYYLYVGNTAA